MRKHLLLIGTLICTASMYSTDENSSFKNLFLSKLKHWTMNHSSFNPELHEDASEEYQQFCKQAYKQLEIPTHECLPIKKSKNLSLNLFNDRTLGGTTPFAIFIDEEKLKNKSQAMKKLVSFHEAAHVKFHIKKVFSTRIEFLAALVSVPALIIGIGLATKDLEQMIILCSSLTLTTSSVLLMKYIKYKLEGWLDESQAEEIAFNALNCYKCVEQVKEELKIGRGNNGGGGYWGVIQMQEIEDTFRKQNKLCSEHTHYPSHHSKKRRRN